MLPALEGDFAKIRGRRDDLVEGRVEARVGRMSKSHSLHHRGGLTLELTMGEDTFDVSERPALFAAVVPGHPYPAYVTPHEKRLVALELAD